MIKGSKKAVDLYFDIENQDWDYKSCNLNDIDKYEYIRILNHTFSYHFLKFKFFDLVIGSLYATTENIHIYPTNVKEYFRRIFPTIESFKLELETYNKIIKSEIREITNSPSRDEIVEHLVEDILEFTKAQFKIYNLFEKRRMSEYSYYALECLSQIKKLLQLTHKEYSLQPATQIEDQFYRLNPHYSSPHKPLAFFEYLLSSCTVSHVKQKLILLGYSVENETKFLEKPYKKEFFRSQRLIESQLQVLIGRSKFIYVGKMIKQIERIYRNSHFLSSQVDYQRPFVSLVRWLGVKKGYNTSQTLLPLNVSNDYVPFHADLDFISNLQNLSYKKGHETIRLFGDVSHEDLSYFLQGKLECIIKPLYIYCPRYVFYYLIDKLCTQDLPLKSFNTSSSKIKFENGEGFKIGSLYTAKNRIKNGANLPGNSKKVIDDFINR